MSVYDLTLNNEYKRYIQEAINAVINQSTDNAQLTKNNLHAIVNMFINHIKSNIDDQEAKLEINYFLFLSHEYKKMLELVGNLFWSSGEIDNSEDEITSRYCELANSISKAYIVIEIKAIRSFEFGRSVFVIELN